MRMQVLLRGAKAGAVGAGGGGALSYLANEASYDENEVETAREHIATLTANVKGKPSGPLARRWAAAKGYAIGIFEIVLALIYKARLALKQYSSFCEVHLMIRMKSAASDSSERLCLPCLQFFIEHAPADSWRIRWFGDLAKGDRPVMLVASDARIGDRTGFDAAAWIH